MSASKPLLGGGGEQLADPSADLEKGGGASAPYSAEKYVQDCDAAVRLGFVRKVFGILAVQLAVSFAAVLATSTMPSVKLFIAENRALFVISMIMPFFIFCVPLDAMRTHPTNLYVLGFFTLAESYLLAAITASYATSIVLEAVLITAVVTVGLVLYASSTERDFTGMGPYLFVALLALIGVGVVSIFFPPSRTMDLVYSTLGALLFSAFLVYDVQVIMTKLGPDDYVLGALNLYLDIINLFLEILKIVARSKE